MHPTHHANTLLTVAAVAALVLVAVSLGWYVIRLIRRDNPQHPAVIDAQDRALIARLTAARDVEPTPADEPDDSLRTTNPATWWMLRAGEREEARRLAESLSATAVAIGLPGYPPPPAIQVPSEVAPVSGPPSRVARHAPRRLGLIQTALLWLASHSVPVFKAKPVTGWDNPEGLAVLDEMTEEHRVWERERADVAEQRIAEADAARALRESMLTPVSGQHAMCECGQCDEPSEQETAVEPAEVERAEDEPEVDEPDCVVLAEVETEGDESDGEQGEEQAPEAPAVIEPELLDATLYEQTTEMHPVAPADPSWMRTGMDTGLTGQLPRLTDELLAAMDDTDKRDRVSA